MGLLPDDAFAIIQFNSRRAFQSKALAQLPFDELFAGSLELWSFDPRDVDRWLLFFTPPVENEPLGTPYSPGAVMRFADPINARKLIETRGAVEEMQLGGKPCLVQTIEHPLAFYTPDDRTIAFGAVKQLEKMLTPTHVKNPLGARLLEAGSGFDLHLLVNIVPLTPALDAVTQAAQAQLPPATIPYVKGLRDISVIEARLNLSGERVLTARIEGRDATATARLTRLANDSGPMVQSAYTAFRSKLLRAWVADAANAVLNVTDSAMARAQVTCEPNAIRLEIPKPEQLDDLGRGIRRAIERNSVPR
jgi:hypothetical protein